MARRNDADSIYPIAILIDELKNEDAALRLNSIKRLNTIAVALGSDRTRNELIPFLNESLDDEDDVLLALSAELGGFVEYVGGPDYAYVLLTPLETLAAAEESSVRDKAVESICRIAERLKPDHVLEHFVPLVSRLAKGDWFSSRTSSCGLFAVVYQRLPSNVKHDFRSLYNQLCHDDTPMVRRAAAHNLGKFAAKVEKEYVKSEVMAMFLSLAADDQDSVRLLSVENCVAIGKILSPEENVAHVLPIIRNATQDKSWRVRYMVADHFPALCEAVGPDVTKSDMVSAFVRLLKDSEAEVRTTAASKVTLFSEMIPVDQVLRQIIQCVKDLTHDSSQYVRTSLASVIMGLSTVVGRAATIEHLLPLYLHLLKDESSEARLAIISKLDQMNKVIGFDLLAQNLLPCIVELAEDKQWRVRLAIIEYIPLLASQLGVDFFNEKLVNLCMTWLGDCVYSIREAATKNLRKLTEIFGISWARDYIIPKVLSLYTHPNYLHRMTSLFAIGVLAEVVGNDVLVQTMLPLMVKMAQDPVPNVRFNVSKTMQQISKYLESGAIQSYVKPALIQLSNDSDRDVKEYAKQALLSIS